MGRSLGAADVNVRVNVDSKDAAGDIRKADRAIGGFGKTLRGVAGFAAAGIAAGAVVQFGSDVVSAASDAEQALGGTQAVFGEFADQVIARSEEAAGAVGLSTTAYQELATQFGASLGNMGIAADELAPKSDKLIGLGADLAAQYGGTTAEAVDAITSLFRGAGDPIEKFGVSIRQSDVNARLAAEGLDDLTGEARKNAEITARMNLLFEQTSSATGAFSRESDTLAGKQARLTATFDNLKTRLGAAVIPVVVDLFDVFAEELLPAIEDLMPVIEALVGFMVEHLEPIIGIVSDAIGLLADLLTGDFSGAWEHAEGILQGFVDFFRGSVNNLIGIWNALDFSISWNPPGWLQNLGVRPISISDIFPDIPLLGSGGIVTRPTIAMVGESGPEAVVPLGSGIGARYEINVYPNVAQHPAEVGRAVIDAIQAYERGAGAAWRATA